MQPPLCCPAHTVMEPKQITFELLMSGAETCTRTAYSHVPNPCRNITDDSGGSAKCCWQPSWERSLRFAWHFPACTIDRRVHRSLNVISNELCGLLMWQDVKFAKASQEDGAFICSHVDHLDVDRSHPALLSAGFGPYLSAFWIRYCRRLHCWFKWNDSYLSFLCSAAKRPAVKEAALAILICQFDPTGGS